LKIQKNAISKFQNYKLELKSKIIVILILFICTKSFGQLNSNLVEKKIISSEKEIKLDSFMILKNQLTISDENGKIIADSLYEIDLNKSTIILKNALINQTLLIKYRTIPIKIPNVVFQNDTSIINKNNYEITNEFVNNSGVFIEEESSEIEKQGSLAKGIRIGNNQNLVSTTQLNLQLSGQLTEKYAMEAMISDHDLPAQNEVNSISVKEFENIYLRVYSDSSSIYGGYLTLKRPQSFFLNTSNSVKGFSFEHKYNLQNTNRTQITAAMSRGKYRRQAFTGIENSQGPYRLTGETNELYIIIVPGSERIFIDGVLQSNGTDKDYTIDYRSAEIYFTTNQLITSAKRIIAEFEYTLNSFPEYVFAAGQGIKSKNWEVDFNLFSQQNSKNALVNENFSLDVKQKISSLGDYSGNLIIQQFDTINSSVSGKGYYLKDSIVNGIRYDSIYVYSETAGKWLTRFFYTGTNSGNYRRIISKANETIFEWIAPQNSIPQGDYNSGIVVSPPEKKQMFTIFSTLKINERTNISFESAISNHDLNLLSKMDDQNNKGLALKGTLSKQFKFSDTSRYFLSTQASFYHVGKNFRAIEKFQEPEFERNWNLPLKQENTSQNYADIQLNAHFFKKISISNLFEMLNQDTSFGAIKNTFTSQVKLNKYMLLGNFQWLKNTNSFSKGKMQKYNVMLQRKWKFMEAGIRYENDENMVLYSNSNRYSPSSWKFSAINAFVQLTDTSNMQLRLEYLYRTDFYADSFEFKKAVESQTWNLKMNYPISSMNKTGYFATVISYRKAKYADTTNQQKFGNGTLAGNLKYGIFLAKNAIQMNGLLETSGGYEPLREYIYVELNSGQGSYKWIDYNQNKIKESGEFEIAEFSDEGQYVKLLLPTARYIPISNYNFNQRISIIPKTDSLREFPISFFQRFSERFSIDFRTKNMINTHDLIFLKNTTEILSANYMLNNSVQFNKPHQLFSGDYNYQQSIAKNISGNGTEIRKQEFHTVNIRLFMFQSIQCIEKVAKGSLNYTSDYLSAKNYEIQHLEYTTKLIIKRTNKWDVSLTWEKIKKLEKVSNSQSIENSFKLNYSFTGSTDLVADISLNYKYIHSSENIPISIKYALLNGFTKGKNIFWNCSVSKKINQTIMLSLVYEGRKLGETKIIHTGNVEIKAMF